MRLPSSAILLLALVLFSGAAVAKPRLRFQPESVKPGDPLLITVLEAKGEPSGSVGGRPLHFYPLRSGIFQALTGIPVEQALGSLPVTVELRESPREEPLVLDAALQVVDPKYPARELKVAGKFIDPPASVKAQRRADRAAFARAFAQPFIPPLFTENFLLPRDGVMTAPYGDLRTFNGKKASQHYGMDLQGGVGAPILASNTGTVVMARDCYSTGTTVILHHGAGLFTAYFHMSRIDVKAGALVKPGQRLGLVGMTGRVTGPHLHWGVKADGLWVDGRTLLNLRFF